LPSLIAPRGGVGTVGSIMNFANNVMGAVAPIVTGMIVGSTHSFTNAFLVAGVVLLTGVASFVFLLAGLSRFRNRWGNFRCRFRCQERVRQCTNI